MLFMILKLLSRKYIHAFTLLVRFYRKVRCVVFTTGGVLMIKCMNVDEARGVCKNRSK